MASTAATLNRALVAAVCFLLLHFSMGQQPTPTPACHDYTGQQPAPTPTPTPAPEPTPAPAPAIDCYRYCASQCNSNCTALQNAGISKCQADSVTVFNSCYDSLTSRTCPGKSCVHSGCGYGNCTCENPNARSCCQQCSDAVSYGYSQCMRTSGMGGASMNYCMLSCTGACNKNCPQG